MRLRTAVSVAVLMGLCAVPSGARDLSASFTVRATVAYSCNLDARQLLDRMKRAGFADGETCFPPIVHSARLAPPPVVTLIHSAAGGSSIVKVVF